MAEQVYFERGDTLQITSKRVLIGGKQYVTSKLSSISVRTNPAQRGCATTMMVMGILVGVGSLAPAIGFELPQFAAIGAVELLVFGGLGWLWRRSKKPSYTVVLGTPSGDVSAFTSPDADLVQEIVRALNQALTA